MENFKVIKNIGDGSYSNVYKVLRIIDNQEYALKRVKLLNLKDKEKENALNEIRILASVKNDNIVSYKEAFWEKNTNSLCIIMDYMDDGDLFQKITYYKKKGKYIDEEEIWNYIIQIFKGLKSLHEKRIFHRDMKSANIFLNKENIIKIGDMNVSKIAKRDMLYTQTGTPYYASPEVWKDQPYNEKSDIWSVGCIIYELCALKPPFRAQEMEGLYKKVIKGNFERIPKNYSDDLYEFIKYLLQVNPAKRPSCEQILKSKFILTKIDSKEIFKDDDYNVNLLNTIKIPLNLHYLTDKLPKPNYENTVTKSLKTMIKINNKVSSMDKKVENYHSKKKSNLPSINYKKEKEKEKKEINRLYNPVINNYKNQNKELQKKIEKLLERQQQNNKKKLIQISGIEIKPKKYSNNKKYIYRKYNKINTNIKPRLLPYIYKS